MPSDLDKTIQTREHADFRTHELVFPHDGVATFARARKLRVALWIGLVAPLVMMVAMPAIAMLADRLFNLWAESHGNAPRLGRWPDLAFAIVFESVCLVVLVGVILLVRHYHPLVLDKNLGRMWRRGKRDPVIGDYAPLKDIEAVQVCSGMSSGSSDSRPFPVFEINLVMKRPAGARVPAMCHGDGLALLADAEKLAAFLGVPLLNHTTAAELAAAAKPRRWRFQRE